MHNFTLLLGQFSSQAQQTVPNSLKTIPFYDSWAIGIMLFSGLVLIAASRAFEANYLKGLIATYFSSSTREDIQKSDIALNSLSSFFLIICGFIGFWLCAYLILEEFIAIAGLNSLLWSALATLFYIVLQFSMLSLTALVTGEFSRMKDNFIQTTLNIQFTGLLLYFLGMIWYLNPKYSDLFAQISIGIIVVSVLVRFLKGIYVSLTNRLPWYYIILYFCTFEILPIVVIYLLVIRNFGA